jgi:hypothetical protein
MPHAVPSIRVAAPVAQLFLRRALVLAVLVRVLWLVVSFLAGAVSGVPYEFTAHPMGAALLAVALAYVDLRRRGEMMLWADLGLPLAAVLAPYALVSALGELLLLGVVSRA